jgi:hypothetical protein
MKGAGPRCSLDLGLGLTGSLSLRLRVFDNSVTLEHPYRFCPPTRLQDEPKGKTYAMLCCARSYDPL